MSKIILRGLVLCRVVDAKSLPLHHHSVDDVFCLFGRFRVILKIALGLNRCYRACLASFAHFPTDQAQTQSIVQNLHVHVFTRYRTPLFLTVLVQYISV